MINDLILKLKETGFSKKGKELHKSIEVDQTNVIYFSLHIDEDGDISLIIFLQKKEHNDWFSLLKREATINNEYELMSFLDNCYQDAMEFIEKIYSSFASLKMMGS